MQNISSSPSFMFRRCVAFLYDSLLLIAVFFVVTAVAVGLNQGNAIENHAFKLLLYAFAFLFFSWFWRNGGQTLGMQAWRIKVVSQNGERISYLQCLKRFLTATILFGVCLLFAAFNKQGNGLHDIASGTKIIKKNK